MPDALFDPKLIATTDQWRFIAQQQGLPGLKDAWTQGTIGTPYADLGFPTESPEVGLYSAVGDTYDISHGMAARGIYAIWTGGVPTVATPPTSLPPDDTNPPIQTPGVLASPLPNPVTGAPVIVGTLWQLALRLLAAAKARATSLPGLGGGGAGLRGALQQVLTALGLGSVGAWVLGLGGDDAAAEAVQEFMEAISQMEEAGIIRPWTAVHRRGPSAGEAIAPRFLIFKPDDGIGWWTTFHMSRSGLQKHDDDQDTHRRPKRAPRRASRSR